MTATLFYVHDPMCSWCWAFRPVWAQVQASLPRDVEVRTLLGGLASDSDSPMPDEMRRFLRDTWHRIERMVPGTRFNFDFWEECSPRRSTYPACRAVVAARRQGVGLEQRMIHAIQRAYYQQARNPSDMATLVELAIEIKLDSGRFLQDLQAESVNDEFATELALARSMGMDSMPSLALDTGGTRWPVPLDYTDYQVIVEHIGILQNTSTT